MLKICYLNFNGEFKIMLYKRKLSFDSIQVFHHSGHIFVKFVK